MTRIVIPASLDRARLDEALHSLAPTLSRSVSRRLCEAGAIARAGVRAGARDRVRAGETIEFHEETVDASLAWNLGVVVNDAEVCVIQKPPGLAVHGGPLVKDSVAARLAKLAALSPLAPASGGTRPLRGNEKGAGLAQRLDRGTSGLLLIGKHADALRALAAAVESRQVERIYRAWVLGIPSSETFTIDAPLRILDEPMGDKPKVVVDLEQGERAVTHGRVLESSSPGAFALSLVELTLETGRTHQIRAHLTSIGHPILGDPRYGDADRNDFARETLGVARPLLHATRLTFPHPKTGERIACQAFDEPDFARVKDFAMRPPKPVNGEGARESGRRPKSPPTHSET